MFGIEKISKSNFFERVWGNFCPQKFPQIPSLFLAFVTFSLPFPLSSFSFLLLRDAL